LGADFSQVRLHNDGQPAIPDAETKAQAFTHGNHIFFSQGKFDPACSEGKQFLTHELTHPEQQGHRVPVKKEAG
jgi:hypothetical protein